MYLEINIWYLKVFCKFQTGHRRNIKEVNEKMAYGDKGGYGDREMHKVICSECKKETEVPFKPSGDRPVYCRDCYQKHRPERRF